MKRMLLLSSARFLMNNPPDIFGRPFSSYKMAYITTASKGVTDKGYLERDRKFFKEQKYNFEEIDLDGKDEQTLRELLKNFESVFVEGGNTFYLMKAIKGSGFDQVIKELLPKGLIYSGGSAGSYVACPSIEMATWRHQNKYDHYGVTDFTGMNLVPFLMSVHYKPEYKELLQEKIKQSKYPVKILTDDQVILVEGDNYQLVGKGEEIKL